MTYFQPRIPISFKNAAESATFTFPLAEYAFEIDQSLGTPDAMVTGAHGSLDMLGDGTAPKGPGIVRVSFTAYDQDPEAVDTTIDEMLTKLWGYGRGWLYSKGSESDVEVYRKTRARIVDMPRLSWKGGDIVNKSASVIFRTDPFWYGEADITATTVTATGTLTVAVQPTIGDTFTIGTKVFTFVAEIDANANGEVGIGANLAAAKVNIVAAINGTDGFNTASAFATAAAFASNTCLVTSSLAGHQGNGIVFSETFTSGSNVMDGSGYLGGTAAGVGGTHSAIRGGFTLTNPGTAPIYDVVITLTATVANPVITNTTTGHVIEMARTDTAVYVFDAGAPSITRNGANDFSSYQRVTGQVQLMRLDPGANVFTITGVTAGTIDIEALPAYH